MKRQKAEVKHFITIIITVMKTKITISLMFLVAVSVYLFTGSFTNETKPETITKPVTPMFTGGGGDNFMIGAFHDAWDLPFNYLQDTLGFNLWHFYNQSSEWGGKHYPTGWTPWAPADTLFADIGNYRAGVQNALDSINSHNMQALMMRPKVEWLCFGQRSDYQCEDTSKVNPDLWFYSFNKHDVAGQYGSDFQDNTIYGDSQWVRYCKPDPEQPLGSGAGFVVKRLKANTEQCRLGDFHADSETDWHIKPRIRIDSAVVDNNPDLLVCKIIVIGQSGTDTLKKVDIKAKYFKDANNNYNGSYKEEYNFSPDPVNLTIDTNWGTDYAYTARGNNTNENTVPNKADIQVYWYGNCDMWIDYVRVDNDVADQLLNPNNPLYPSRQQWLQWEAQDIACHLNGAASYRFYIELFEFNNIPCMSYVSRKLDSIVNANCPPKHVTLMTQTIPFFYSWHVPWSERLTVYNLEHIKRNFVEKVGVQEILLSSYPFNSSYHYPETYPYCTWTKIPKTLPTHSGTGTLARDTTPAAYDEWLQNYLDSVPYSFESGYNGPGRNPVQNDPGGFRYTMQLGDAMSKETGLPFIFHTSAHIWFCKCGATDTSCDQTKITGEVQREPTNEELDLVSNVAVSYGSRGLIYFWYPSTGNIGDTFYSRGIADTHNGSEFPPRRLNVYGQPKWDKVKSLVQRMKAWEPYVMSFDNANRHSYIYRIEREALISDSYFTEIYSLKISNSTPACEEDFPEDIATYWVAECKKDKYLQVATFKKAIDDGNKYFMIVNRRCSPYKNELSEDDNGGRRWIKVRFDKNHIEMYGFDRWQIYDIETGAMVADFYKTLLPLIDLEIFMSGTGKLYKLVPVG